jgi:hypothetical protein
MEMLGRPAANEAAEYYSGYIQQAPGDDVMSLLELQAKEFPALLAGISEERSLDRYAPDKWSMRELLNHINDTERAFVFRAVWFARGFDSPLPGFDQNIAAAGAGADGFSWASHVEDFRAVRAGTVTFFRNLPDDAWGKTGIASGNSFTVRALAYITAGHAAHHMRILRERYLAG